MSKWIWILKADKFKDVQKNLENFIIFRRNFLCSLFFMYVFIFIYQKIELQFL